MGRLLSLPGLTAAGLGRFRIYVGVVLLWLLAQETPQIYPAELHRNYSPLADFALIHWLAASEAGWRAVQFAGIAAAVLFTVGWWTRTAYAGLVASLLLTRLTWLHSSGQHDWVCAMAILICLLPVPWGDGLSIDQWRHPTVPATASDPRYGLALFVPSLVMGLSFAAAAYAKLSVSGFAWVTTGAVRYHFVEDAENAVTTWGLWVAAHPAIAVALSAAAVLLEGTWIATISLRRPAPRLLAAAAALGLFLGFLLFQGLLWLPWMMWLGALLPWDGWRRLPSVPLRGVPAMVAAAALTVQAVASLAWVEVEPLMSPYWMYAGTYTSPRHFETARQRKFRRVEIRTGTRRAEVGGEAGDSLAVAVDGGVIDENAREALDGACNDSRAAAVEVWVNRAQIDWTAPRVTRKWVATTRSLPCR